MVRIASAGSCRLRKIDSDVSKLLQFASREKVPVTARGAGYGYVGGCVPARGGIALSLMRDESDQGNQFCRRRRHR